MSLVGLTLTASHPCIVIVFCLLRSRTGEVRNIFNVGFIVLFKVNVTKSSIQIIIGKKKQLKLSVLALKTKKKLTIFIFTSN